MNEHLNLCQDTDIKKIYTEISSLTPNVQEKPASTGSHASFQDFERHCSKTALHEKMWGIPAVPLKILKLAWEPIAGPWDLQTPPHFRLFSSWWWPQIIDLSESKWPKFFDVTKIFWQKKMSFFFFDFWAFCGAPGGPRTKNSENYFYIFYGIRETGIRETGIRGGVVTRESVISSETAW